MILTNDIIESRGFKKINNSMWRLGNITLQNAWNHVGSNIYEKILNTCKAYKACYKGNFIDNITTIDELNELINNQEKECYVFTHLWVDDFGWENTILLPTDFEFVLLFPIKEDGSDIFYGYNDISKDNTEIRKFKGYIL
jgi:hypothetical protein